MISKYKIVIILLDNLSAGQIVDLWNSEKMYYDFDSNACSSGDCLSYKQVCMVNSGNSTPHNSKSRAFKLSVPFNALFNTDCDKCFFLTIFELRIKYIIKCNIDYR